MNGNIECFDYMIIGTEWSKFSDLDLKESDPNGIQSYH